MQRYFINKTQIDDKLVIMSKDDSHHIIKVMRMKIGEKIELCVDKKTYLGQISSFDGEIALVTIVEEIEEDKELSIDVTIAQGMVNRTKMEEVIEKISMLGASSYLFFPMERSVVKADLGSIDKKMPRFATIAKEASEVAHRQKIMDVGNLKTFKEFLKLASTYDYCLYAYEKTEFSNHNFKRILKEIKNTHKKILILVGPEGGISETEVDMLEKTKFLPITLGPRILRTELAPSYIMSAISYELELED